MMYIIKHSYYMQHLQVTRFQLPKAREVAQLLLEAGKLGSHRVALLPRQVALCSTRWALKPQASNLQHASRGRALQQQEGVCAAFHESRRSLHCLVERIL